MIKDSFNSIGASARGLFKNPLGLLLLCALYLAMLRVTPFEQIPTE